jgi:hypothetical protein
MKTKQIFLTMLIVLLANCLSYGQENLLTNGGFEDGVLTPFTSYTSAAVGATWEVVTEDAIEGNYCVKATLGAAGANSWDAWLKYQDLIFQQGKYYTFSAFLKCTTGTMQVMLKPELNQDPYTGYGAETVTINDQWQEYHVTTPVLTGDVNPADIVFLMAYSAGTMWIDGVRFYEGDFVPTILQKGEATEPSPGDNTDDVPRTITLSWMNGDFAATHNIFFGTDFNNVDEATVSEPLGTITSIGQAADVNTFVPGLLEIGKTYYWRVDEVNAPASPGEFKGQVWTFTAEPYSYKIPAENIINVTASSSTKGDDPNNTKNESGLDPEDMDLHSNKSETMWLSSGADINNVWIRYDFDRVYKLHEMLVWNYNVGFFLVAGFKDVNVEYSVDGQTWIELTNVPEFAEGTGANGYEYNTVVDFNEITAQSVRLTVNSNWSGGVSPYSGLSEVRFMYIPVRAREPQPEVDSVDVPIDKTLKWRVGREADKHYLYISTDVNSVEQDLVDPIIIDDPGYMPELTLGNTYYWKVNEVNNAETPSVWASDIWNFSTAEFLTLDDFEDYNDTPPDTVWNTWKDGLEDPAYGGSRMGYEYEPFCETTIVQNGNQSAPIYYDNLTANNSEVERTFDSIQNLTVYGSDTLRLYYRGNAVEFAETSPGTVVMSGGGADIYGTNDAFRYVYMELTGDGSIIARVDSLETVGTYSKAGVMIRETLDAGSKMADSIWQANNSLSFQRRTATNAPSSQNDVYNAGTLPVWLKIKRLGNTFISERSADGITWEPIDGGEEPATIDITMADTVYIGLAVCSNSYGNLAAATFSGVETIGIVSGTWQVANVGDEFQGETNTLDRLYVALEDNAGHRKEIYAPETAVGVGNWTEWLIPFTEFDGVDTTKIKKIAIGIGNTANPMKGKGLVYIDNIGYGHILEP